jgi:ATP-binding cassette, subfamily B, bacterial
MTFSLLLKTISPHRSALLLVLALLLANSGLSLTQPWMAGQLTASILTPEDSIWGMQQVLIAWLTLMVLSASLGFLSQYYIGSTGELMATRMRGRLYQHTQALPLAYHQQRRGGDTLAIISNDAYLISGFVTDTVVHLLPLLLTFGGAFIAMALISPAIATLALLLLPPYYLVLKIVGRQMRPLSRARIDAYSSLIAIVTENLAMLPAIKAFTRESEEQQRFDLQNQQLMSIWRRQLLIKSLLGPVVALVAGLGLILLLWLGGAAVASNQLSAAELVSLLLYAMLMSQPLRGLANVYGQLQTTRGAAERIMEFLGEAPEPDDDDLPDLPPLVGDIELKSVHFQYPGGNPVLEGLNLRVAAGETIAITGRNGAGKSTLAHLIMRFADPLAGTVLIDEHDVSQYSLASLRSQIGLVAQHTLLTNGTVAENIAYGLPFADMTAIERAARQAHAEEFISEMKLGYQTLIGDQGVRLSGGQRQRLALARALLVNPPILIFDEATAMFDPTGEKAFIDECHELLAVKTVILITHRPASLALADRVIDLSGPDSSRNLYSSGQQSSHGG